jgi:F-type H+-transporting ATPase subunit epsilon
MSGTIQLEVVTPEKMVVKENAKIVMAPGASGEFGVLPGHTSFFTSLKIGAIHYRDNEDKDMYVFVNGGFSETLPDRVTVLADSAERKTEINIDRAKAAKGRAEKRLTNPASDIDIERARAALLRAVYRLDIAGVN